MLRLNQLTSHAGLTLLVCALLAPKAGAEPRYTITDLGTLGGTFSGASSINNRGQIAGTSLISVGSSIRHPYIWENGVMTDLGSPGGDSTAADINELGHVSGNYQPPGSSPSRAFLYENGQFTDLGAFTARGLNNNRQLAAFSANYAYLYQNGQLINLGTLGGNYSDAFSINDSGQVTGLAHRVNDPAGHAFLWQDGNMVDLGTLGGDSSTASDINNRGQIVGTSDTDGAGLRAFLYDNGQMIDLGTLGGPRSGASAINERGQIVGNSWTEPFPTDYFGFLWEDGVMYNLQDLVPPDSGWHLRLASDINDDGWIVGAGFNPQGQPRAFLLTPVPEPAALTTLIALSTIARRRRFPYRSR